ncbi:hypothetical protein SEA_TARDUS_71 [Gordonia phage Tardus]|uniref:Uncharacterized protein n=1 Tax=Gordonia phage Tardus TaxID=2939734 RepID=A0A9E7E4R8_9CAUD|nr:hypothetical protein SEA_TARDUS_71 [Gordonia phage Tardus]
MGDGAAMSHASDTLRRLLANPRFQIGPGPRVTLKAVLAEHDVAEQILGSLEADEWCKEESCRHRHWRSGAMPTHRRGADCPPRSTDA